MGCKKGDNRLYYTIDEALAAFDPATVERGLDYYLNNHVLQLAGNAEGDIVSGRVKGSGSNIYTVNVNLFRQGNHLTVQSHCSCPVEHNCKHAMAVLLANARHYETNSSSTSGSNRKHQEIQNWLNALESRLTVKNVDTSNDVASNTVNRLLYVLEMVQLPNAQQLRVQYQSARQLKTGGWGKSTRYSPENIVNKGRAAFISTDDEKILRQVYARNIMDHVPFENLSASDGAVLLQKMLATGRCFWLDRNNIAVKPGPALKASTQWQLNRDGTQQLAFVTEDPVITVLPTTPPFYFYEAKGECGPLHIDVPEEAIALIQSAPAIDVQEVEKVAKKLKSLIPNLPSPAKVKVKTKTQVKPTVSAYFKMYRYEEAADYFYGTRTVTAPVIEIELDYAGIKTAIFSDEKILIQKNGNELVKVERDSLVERDIIDLMEELDIVPLRLIAMDDSLPENLFSLPYPEFVKEHDVWIDFMMRDLPVMERNGWQIQFADDFIYNISTVDQWHMEIDEDRNGQWFDLNLNVEVKGKSYNLVDIISSLMKHNPKLFSDTKRKDKEHPEQVFVRIKDGSLLSLPYERVAAIIKVLVDLYDHKGKPDTSLRLAKWRAAELGELQSTGLQWQGSEELKASAKRLQQFEGITPCDAPQGFNAQLRPYQKDGLAWLQFLAMYDFHGVLADDMGLGKTIQALAHILEEKNNEHLTKPVLVVAPTSLMFNWRHETEQFAPGLKLLTLHGPERSQYFDVIAEQDIVLTTYSLLGRDEEILLAQEWHMVILDEAQNIKNFKTKASKTACQLTAKHRLCLSGTPLENHLGELWSMFHFLMPGLLGDEKQFRQLFRTPIEKQGDTDRAQRLAKRLAPFMLRRTKDEVVKELPPKTEIIQSVALEGAQRDLYETIRVSMQKKVRDSFKQLGVNKSHIIVLDALLKLRQICCDPRLLKMQAGVQKMQSAKLSLLMQLLPELLEEGRKILLFSQFTSMLSLIEEELTLLKIDYVKLTGSTRNREKPITDFQNGKVPLFLISLKAGGTGLNLTAADTVIHYDPWWNPAVEAQATDRAHRIGQDKPVFVYKLLTEDTVEAKIQKLQESKKKLADGLFDSSGKGKLPGPEDLEALFEPLG